MERLTKWQEECLRLSATMTDKEIARALGISESTVDRQFREVLRKFDVSSRKDALRKLAAATVSRDPVSEAPQPRDDLMALNIPAAARRLNAAELKSQLIDSLGDLSNMTTESSWSHEDNASYLDGCSNEFAENFALCTATLGLLLIAGAAGASLASGAAGLVWLAPIGAALWLFAGLTLRGRRVRHG